MPRTKSELKTIDEWCGKNKTGCDHSAGRDRHHECKICGHPVCTKSEMANLVGKADGYIMLLTGLNMDDMSKLKGKADDAIAGLRQELAEAVDARKADGVEHKKHIVALTDQLAIEHTAAALARKMAHCLVDIGSSSGV